MSSLSLVASERGFETPDTPCGCCEHSRDSLDLVALKISLLGDSQIGKTKGFEISDLGLNQMDKTLCVGGARIAYRIWEVAVLSEGIKNEENGIKYPCSASPPHGIFSAAIPVLIGTKFDDFVQLPIDVRWTIASKSICKGLECNTFLFKCNLQHKCEQDLQVHHGKAVQPTMGSRAKPHNRRTHHRFLDVAWD
ncbi:unnamed protein product [Camellia sinensis]